MRREAHFLLVAFGVSFCAGASLVATSLFAIEPLLPEEGRARCFSQSFDAAFPLVFGWRQQPPVPAPVTAMSLRIERWPDQERYHDPGSGYRFDWRYTAHVRVNVKGRDGTLSAPTSCDWREHPLNRVDPWLLCFIDCDGGGISISRVPGRSAVDVVWDHDNHLRMSECGGGGAILRAGDETRTFRLAEVPSSDCPPLQER